LFTKIVLSLTTHTIKNNWICDATSYFHNKLHEEFQVSNITCSYLTTSWKSWVFEIEKGFSSFQKCPLMRQPSDQASGKLVLKHLQIAPTWRASKIIIR